MNESAVNPEAKEALAGAEKARKVASFWDENARRLCAPFAHWESPAPIQHALNKLVTGDISIPPPVWFMRHYGPFAHVAELGCGDGILVHGLLDSDPGLSVDAYDISTASLARAAERIKTHCGTTERCRFLPIDLNKEILPQAAYDAVLTTGTMHHVENLDFCFRNIARSLRPGGSLWLNDYVGPNRFQWSNTQMRLADELLALVPKAWRRRDKVARCDDGALGAMDPSEAVASQHIEAAMAAHFEIVQKWPRGGTLLAPIFGSGCLDAAIADSPKGLATLAAIFEAEQQLIRDGALPSDSYVYIAKPRTSVGVLVREAFERRAGPLHKAAANFAHGADESAVRGELLEINRNLLIVHDRLAEIDARLARFEPLMRAGSFASTGLRRLTEILRFSVKLEALGLHWRETHQRIKDARFCSERLVFVRKINVAAFAGHLRRSLGLFPPTVYRVQPRQRVALASRPRILHAIANVWVGGSTQLIVDLHNHLGHRFEMKVVTSALPAHGSHKGMSIDVVPKPNSRHLVRRIFSRFRPHIVHVHYWGDVDESWYKTIFEIAAEFGRPIVQNVNTPVAPFAGVRVDHNVFVSHSVHDQFGSTVPASVIYPGIDLDRFAPPDVIDPDSFDVIGMIYRLETDKLDKDAIELFLEIAKRRPKTRIVIIGDGSLFAHFRSRVEQEGRLLQFEFAGYVPDEQLQAQLARYKTFVAPVRQESFGHVVPFAMRSGLAVAGYNVGAIPEILGGTETLGATLAETVDIVTALLDDPKRIAALGERNRALALERFSVEDMAFRYFQLYRDLAPRDVELLSGLPDAVHFPV